MYVAWACLALAERTAFVAEAIRACVCAFSERLTSAEAKEAFTAFFEKRKPNFGG